MVNTHLRLSAFNVTKCNSPIGPALRIPDRARDREANGGRAGACHSSNEKAAHGRGGRLPHLEGPRSRAAGVPGHFSGVETIACRYS
jgi:hypothetical protein